MKKRSKIFHLNLLLIGLAISGCILACSKTKGGGSGGGGNHQIDENDNTFPVLTINRPVASQEFINGDSIRIEGQVTDNSLYNGKIKIVNDANGLLINEKAYETHYFTLFNFSFAHKASVSVITDYTITVEFEDHGLNKTTKTVKVKVNP